MSPRSDVLFHLYFYCERDARENNTDYYLHEKRDSEEREENQTLTKTLASGVS